MIKTITIEQYECLRKHLELMNEIFNRPGTLGSNTAPKAAPKQTKQQMVDQFKNLIDSKQRATKSLRLKKK